MNTKNQKSELVMMSEGSHHENIWVSGHIVGTMRVTNSGKIISIWMSEPYNQLFFPDQA